MTRAAPHDEGQSHSPQGRKGKSRGKIMATTTQHAPGTFCWPELATTDQDGAKKFYAALFGWGHEDNPMDQGGVYTMLKLKGAAVGALYGMPPEESKMAPPRWNSYVAVESADQAATRAKQLGGTVMMEPFEVMEHGRMAILQDPTGATFCVWQPKKHTGAGVLDEVGALCWTELMTSDTGKAGTFYTGLFPWKAEEMSMPGMKYTIFKRGNAQAGGMMAKPAEMGPIPSHWLVYFQVDDCDGYAAKAKGLGGKVAVPPTDIPSIGRFSVLQDPQGATFAVIKLATPA